jgi:hypothetical protein
MDAIKEAFQKVKQDIDSLKEALTSITQCMIEINSKLKEVTESLGLLKVSKKFQEIAPLALPPVQDSSSTHPQKVSTNMPFIPADNLLFKPQKDEKQGISIGNEGVPTDRQTNQQTNQQTQNPQKSLENPIEDAAEILDSLDSLKKEIRLKFKNLTDQEWAVFSLIYQLDEEGKEIDYRVLAQRLNLTESSIRDYVGKLINKGIPISKIKVNNKQIHLSISKNLKKIAPLSVLIQLRDL